MHLTSMVESLEWEATKESKQSSESPPNYPIGYAIVFPNRECFEGIGIKATHPTDVSFTSPGPPFLWKVLRWKKLWGPRIPGLRLSTFAGLVPAWVFVTLRHIQSFSSRECVPCPSFRVALPILHHPISSPVLMMYNGRWPYTQILGVVWPSRNHWSTPKGHPEAAPCV